MLLIILHPQHSSGIVALTRMPGQLAFIPSAKSYNDLDEIQKALVYAQAQLTRGMPHGTNEDWQRYSYFVNKANGANYLTHDYSNESSNSWDGSINVDGVLSSFFPSEILPAVRSVFPALQDIMNEYGAPIDSFSHFWANTTSEDRTVMEFSIMQTPSWDVSYFDVYYLTISAHFRDERVLFVENITHHMDARYIEQRYSVKSAVVVEMKQNEANMNKEIDEWLSKVKTC